MKTKQRPLPVKSTRGVLLLFAILLCPVTVYAQGSASLGGKVTDRNGTMLPGATVLLLSGDSAAYVKGSVTDQTGSFRLTDIPQQKYNLEVSMIGFKKAEVRLDLNGRTDADAGNIALEEDVRQLNEVVVTGELPSVRYEPGKVVVDISSSALSRQGSALEVLKNMPGVIVREDGSVFLYGQAGVQVLMDGRQTYLSGENLVHYLLSIPAAAVNQIELITQPSSAFDASGNAGVINISTKRRAVRGVNVSVYSNYRQGKYAKSNSGFSLAVRKNKISVYADYSYYWGKEFMYVESGRKYLVSGGMPDVLLDMHADRRYKHRSHWGRAGMDYDISERISTGLYASVSHYMRTTDEANVSAFGSDLQNRDSVRTTFNVFDDRYSNITAGAYFSMKVKEKGKWESSFDFQNFDSRNKQHQSGFLSIADRTEKPDTMSGKTDGNIRIYSAKSDLRLPLTGKTVLNAGIKTAFVLTPGNTLYEKMENGAWLYDESLSSGFRYRENINAAYSSVQYTPSPVIGAEAGLRVEHTATDGRQYAARSVADSSFSQRYTNFFPSAMFRYAPSEAHTLSLIYGQRIVRPNYGALNPAVIVNDNYLHEKGNVGLKPELCHNIELSYLFKKNYNLTLLYSERRHPVVKGYIREEDDLLITGTPMNIPRARFAGMRIGVSNLQPLAWWTMHANVSLAYSQFHWITNNVLTENSTVTPNAYMSHRLRIPGEWTVEVTGFYNGKTADGQAVINPVWSVAAGIRKSFFDDRLTVFAYVDDIFASNNAYIHLMGDLFTGWYKEKRMNRVFGLNVSYRFSSGSKVKESRQESMPDESKRVNLR
ncbi:MAG: TonB-dependent receptor [Bacteroidales bacterium]|nr:TonB-dependent receptor [Bacteroidales bacterium]